MIKVKYDYYTKEIAIEISLVKFREKKKKCYCTTFMDNECSFPKKTLSYKY